MAAGNHPDIIGPYVHVIHNWSYADATARGAATGFVASDLFKIALQEDDNSLWMLVDETLDTWEQLTGSGASAVTSVNGATGAVVLDADDIADTATNVFATPAELAKLAGIEAGADVTDAANVAAAGAVMESDTSTTPMGFVIDEDSMASDLATKVPTQQSVKAYVDAQVAGGGYTDEMARDAIGAALVAGNNIDLTVSDVGDTITIDVEGLTSADLSDFAEALDDRVSVLLIAGNNIDIAYNDGAGTLTIDVESLTSADLTDFAEAVDDRVGALFTDSTNIDVIYNDAGNAETIDLTTAFKTITLNFVIDGGGSAITTGVKGDLVVDFACAISGATALADQSGSIVIDIWKDTYANFPPVDADSITASAPVTITTATKSQDSTLTGWTTAISAGDILRFNVDSITTIQRVTIALKVVRT